MEHIVPICWVITAIWHALLTIMVIRVEFVLDVMLIAMLAMEEDRTNVLPVKPI